MKHLLIWIALCALTFSVLIPLVGMLGRTAPSPEFAKWFTYADGSPCTLPCLFGVRPGVTDLNEAQVILKAHPLLNGIEFEDFYADSSPAFLGAHRFSETGFTFSMTLNQGENNIVQSISISPYSFEGRSLLLGHLITLFGIPQTVALSYYNNYNITEFTYRNETIFASVADRTNLCRLKLNMVVEQILIYPVGYYEEWLQQLQGGDAPTRYYPWAGISREAYWNRYYEDFYGGSPGACTP